MLNWLCWPVQPLACISAFESSLQAKEKEPSKAYPPALTSQGATSLNQGYQQRTTEGFCAGERETGSAALERLTGQIHMGSGVARSLTRNPLTWNLCQED